MSEMRRESPYPMVLVDEARRLIAAQARQLATEQVRTAAAFGRVLAEDLTSAEDMPDVPKSAVDGYALLATDGNAPRRVVGELLAGGSAALRLRPGEAARIMTGAPLPPGADTVVMVEQTLERDGMMTLERAPRSGESVHTIGQDIRAGELVLSAGTPIGVAETALLMTLGHTEVRVTRRPVVAVLSTGDEVQEPDVPLRPGSIRDSNRYALLAAAHEAGCDVRALGIARDAVAEQRAAILDGLADADVLLTSGGVSMGTRDLIKPLLAELGTVHFGRVMFKPGKPTTFATIGSKLVFGLPGYPVSSLVSFEVFVRPALRRLQGDLRPERPVVQVYLADPIRPSLDRPEYQRVIIRWEDGRPVARSTGAQGSSRLLSLRGANGLLVVPPGAAIYPADTQLSAMLTGPIW